MDFLKLTGAETLAAIDPVDPESLHAYDNGSWGARFAPPIPGADLVLLRNTPGVKILADEHPIERLPGWIEVTFAVTELHLCPEGT